MDSDTLRQGLDSADHRFFEHHWNKAFYFVLLACITYLWMHTAQCLFVFVITLADRRLVGNIIHQKAPLTSIPLYLNPLSCASVFSCQSVCLNVESFVGFTAESCFAFCCFRRFHQVANHQQWQTAQYGGLCLSLQPRLDRSNLSNIWRPLIL